MTTLAGSLTRVPARPDERIARVFDMHYEAIWRTLLRLGVRDALVDDAAQRVFLVATRRLSEITVGEEGRYLYGVALRVASESRRRDPARRELPNDLELPDAAAGPEATLLAHEARDALDATLAAMSEPLREVLVLSELEELPAPEVAALLDIPVGTVASRLRRARDEFSLCARRVRAQLERKRR